MWENHILPAVPVTLSFFFFWELLLLLLLRGVTLWACLPCYVVLPMGLWLCPRAQGRSTKDQIWIWALFLWQPKYEYGPSLRVRWRRWAPAPGVGTWKDDDGDGSGEPARSTMHPNQRPTDGVTKHKYELSNKLCASFSRTNRYGLNHTITIDG